MLRLRQRSPKETSPSAANADEALPMALLEFQSPTAAIIAVPVPPIARHTIWWVSLMLISFLIVCTFMPIEELVTANGSTVSDAAPILVQPFTASIVKSINVASGQFVHKGQILGTLDPTVAVADLTAMTSQQQGYAAQAAQLQAQEDGKPYIPDPNNPASALQLQTYSQQVAQYNFTVDDYHQKIAALQTQIDGFNSQAVYYRQQIGIAQNVQTMRTQLQNMQVGSRLDTLSATSTLVSEQASLASAVSSAQQAQQQLASQQAELDAFTQQWRASTSTQLAQALVNLQQAQDALAKAKLNNNLVVLTATQDSIVQDVAPVSVGSVLQSGDTFFQLMPVDAPMSVLVQVDGANSGYIRVGDPVIVKFATMPFLEFGDAKGTVKIISANSVNPLATSGPTSNGPPLPGAPQDLFYNVEISLDVLNLHNAPPGFRIVPGMPLEADMKVGTQTVMDFFTQRILPVAYDSLHDPG